MGTLTGIQCGASPPKATIQVDSSVLRACVGNVDPAQRFSKAMSATPPCRTSSC
jgi:hypothetical protein